MTVIVTDAMILNLLRCNKNNIIYLLTKIKESKLDISMFEERIKKLQGDRDGLLERLEEEKKWKKHIREEGSRQHVLSYDTQGRHCSEFDCEINRPREERDGKKKKTNG